MQSRAFPISHEVLPHLQVPHDHPSVYASRADLRDLSAALLVRAELVDRVLVHSRQLRDLVSASATAQVHSSE